jgi:GT2 family glycosyltransferase
VVLNYRTPDDAILAVGSLQAADVTLKIIVVDNGSGDGSVSRLRTLPDVELIELPANVGFSAGCNAGITRALNFGAGAVLLVNSDTIVPPDAPGVVRAVLERDRHVGIAGPVVRKRSTPDIIESAGIHYNQTTGRMRLLDHRLPFSGLAAFETRPADAVAGCAMMVRRDVFEMCGLLSEDYSFGFEDIDLCLRARQQGLATVCCRSAFVLHEGQRSIGRRSSSRAYFATRNHLLLASRYPEGDSTLHRRFRLARVLAFNLAHAITGGEMPRMAALGRCLAGARDFAGRRQRPTTPVEHHDARSRGRG